MVRIFTFILSCLVALPVFAKPIPAHSKPFDHVIFFGDSLSDIGNMPMSPTLIEPSTKMVALNLYVPISNPMIPNGHFYRVPLTTKLLPYPIPSPTRLTPLSIHGKSYQRKFHSLNWTQFFLTDMQKAGLVSNKQPLVPWVWWHQYSNDVRSINYAFAGATSQDNCRDFEYQHPNAKCDGNSVYQAQIPYRNASQNPANHDAVTLVQVPGVEKQVQMYLDTIKNHPGLATDKTLYVILVGGNDLNLDLLELQKHHYFSAFSSLLHGTSYNVSSAVNLLHHYAHAKNIVIMNLFDMRETPYLHTNIVKLAHLNAKQEQHLLALTYTAVNMYDKQLKRFVKRDNFFQNKLLHKHRHLYYFDTKAALNVLANSPVYNTKRTRYLMCIKHSGVPPQYYVNKRLCTNKGAKYLFWNGAHPSIYVGEYLGYRLMQQIRQQLPN